MKRLWLVGVIWLGLCGSAEGGGWHSKTFTVTQEPHRVALLGDDWRRYDSTYMAEDGKHFVAFSPRAAWCRDYGRYGDLRVKENSCDGQLTITLRSVGEPASLTLEWAVYR